MRARTTHILLVTALVAYSWVTFPTWHGAAIVTGLALATLAY